VKALLAEKLNYSSEEIKQILVYIAAFFQNCGNFKSFGDTKFIPEIGEEKFLGFIKATEAYIAQQQLMDFLLG
jgi:dipeptidyl-peptidase-3